MYNLIKYYTKNNKYGASMESYALISILVLNILSTLINMDIVNYGRSSLNKWYINPIFIIKGDFRWSAGPNTYLVIALILWFAISIASRLLLDKLSKKNQKMQRIKLQKMNKR